MREFFGTFMAIILFLIAGYITYPLGSLYAPALTLVFTIYPVGEVYRYWMNKIQEKKEKE